MTGNRLHESTAARDRIYSSDQRYYQTFLGREWLPAGPSREDPSHLVQVGFTASHALESAAHASEGGTKPAVTPNDWGWQSIRRVDKDDTTIRSLLHDS
jgi:hypothetical protein